MEGRIVPLIIRLVAEVWTPEDGPVPDDLGPDSPLLGPSGLLSSMGLVSLLLALEQELEGAYGVTVRLADERAMSHRESPFRTIATLAGHAARLLRGAN